MKLEYYIPIVGWVIAIVQDEKSENVWRKEPTKPHRILTLRNAKLAHKLTLVTLIEAYLLIPVVWVWCFCQL